jgi:hypothetical protein
VSNPDGAPAAGAELLAYHEPAAPFLPMMNYSRKSLSLQTVLVILGICASLLSCSKPEIPPDDSWYRPAPEGFPYDKPMDSALFAPVDDWYRRLALKMLGDAEWKEISKAEAAKLASNAPTQPGTRYLVRGLCMSCCIDCETGNFELYLHQGSLLVDNFGFGSGEGGRARWPVIVVLEHPPEQLFVQCGAAE